MATFQVLTGRNDIFDTSEAAGNRDYPEAVKAKSGTMKPLCPCRFIREQLSVKRCLLKILAGDRHCRSVGFKEEKRSIATRRLADEFQGKDLIGDNAKFLPVGKCDVPAKRFPLVLDMIREWDLIPRKQANATGFATRQFQSNHHIGNQQRVFEKQPPDSTVFPARIQILAVGIGLLPQDGGSFAPNAINKMP